MSACAGLDAAEAMKFRESLSRLESFEFAEDDITKNKLSLLLDEVVAVDSSVSSFQNEFEGSKLLGHLARQIPFHQDRLIAKMCHTIFNFCVLKNVTFTNIDLQTVVTFLTESLLKCPSYIHVDILSALSAVCEGNTYRMQKFYDALVGGQGMLLQLTDDTTHEEEVVVEAVKCLAAFTNIKLNNADCIEVRYLSASFDTFVHLLHRTPHMVKMSLPLRNKLLMHCFSGIQSIVLLKRLPNIELGSLFAAVRAYMFYGLTSHTVNIPTQLYPNVVTPSDPLASSKALKPSGEGGNAGAVSSTIRGEKRPVRYGGVGSGGPAATGQKSRNKKPRKKKGKGGKEAEDSRQRNEDMSMEDDHMLQKAGAGTEVSDAKWSNISPEAEFLSWEMTYLKVSSSDSEFSDTEGGRLRQQKSEGVRVRQFALTCFLNIVRTIDKKVMFGYWSSFLPDFGMNTGTSTSPLTQSLFTTILKDPAPKCRMVALASLTSMLESTRPYLVAAEDISTHQSAFTSFSAVLGSMIKEMHRCLLLALVAENFNSVITHIIKCLANLVNNVPYYRLTPGLLTRVLKQIRHFFDHKDPNVRTAALTCIGAMVGIKPPLMEVSQLIKSPQPPVGVNKTVTSGDSPFFGLEEATSHLYHNLQNHIVTENVLTPPQRPENQTSLATSYQERHQASAAANINLSSSSTKGHQDVTSDKLKADSVGSDSDKIQSLQTLKNPAGDLFESGEPVNAIVCHQSAVEKRSSQDVSEVTTPVLDERSGIETPVFSDQLLQAHAREISWVIKLCLKNITGQPELLKDDVQSRFEPLPVRLEALQVMSNLIKNYFPIIRQSLCILQNLVQMCFEDANHIIKLHGAKVLDELTQALQRDVIEAKFTPGHVIPIQQVLDFWLFLLTDPLPKLLKVNPEMPISVNNLVQAAACDCMANIGEEIFAKLPTPYRMNCLAHVLGLASDEDKLIKASSVRALGIYVMYDCLKDDVGFVSDAAKSILNCMPCPSATVRFKAAWAMANLCATLVSNKDNEMEEFVCGFSDSLLLQLVQQTASSIRDSDKTSCNAARALGNLLRYLPARSFQEPLMSEAIDKAVKGLVKNMSSGAMKVRWNSCYAVSNAFQNEHLPYEKPFLSDILSMLNKVVQTCSNFKVRINAALALAAPRTRQGYGSCDMFSNVWTSLVSALETAENINDFAEYKYKDSLIEHICGAILHLTSLAEIADLSTLAPSVHVKGHSFRMYMEKFSMLESSRTAPSNVPTIVEVKAHLESLQNQTTSEDHRRCLQALIQACAPDLDASDEKSPEKSQFQQVYD